VSRVELEKETVIHAPPLLSARLAASLQQRFGHAVSQLVAAHPKRTVPPQEPRGASLQVVDQHDAVAYFTGAEVIQGFIHLRKGEELRGGRDAMATAEVQHFVGGGWAAEG